MNVWVRTLSAVGQKNAVRAPAKDSTGRLVIPITNLLSVYRHFQVGKSRPVNAVCDTRLQISVHPDEPAFNLAGQARRPMARLAGISVAVNGRILITPLSIDIACSSAFFATWDEAAVRRSAVGETIVK